MTPRAGRLFGRLGTTSVQRAASAGAPGLNVPVMNFGARVALRLADRSPRPCGHAPPSPAWGRLTPSGNPPASSPPLRSCGPSCSPARRPRSSKRWAYLRRNRLAPLSSTTTTTSPLGSVGVELLRAGTVRRSYPQPPEAGHRSFETASRTHPSIHAVALLRCVSRGKSRRVRSPRSARFGSGPGHRGR
jgi:hypothetical protein